LLADVDENSFQCSPRALLIHFQVDRVVHK